MAVRSPSPLDRFAHKREERAIERAEKRLAYILRKHKNPAATSESEIETASRSEASIFGPGTVTRSCTNCSCAANRSAASSDDCGEPDYYNQIFKDLDGVHYTCRTHYFKCDGHQMMSREIWLNSLKPKPKLMDVSDMRRIIRNKKGTDKVRSMIAKGGNVAVLLSSGEEARQTESKIVEGKAIHLPTEQIRIPLTKDLAGCNIDMDLRVKVGKEKPRDLKMHLEMPNFEAKRVMVNGKWCKFYEY